MNTFNKEGQYLLPFKTEPQLQEQDFMISSCNEIAYKSVKFWPHWQHFALNIYGPASSGKTHLAHIWIEMVQKSLKRPLKIPLMTAQSINMKNLNKIANEYPYLVIENLDSSINEEALFHLYNFYNAPERYLLITSSQALSKIPLKLPDLRSRLNTIPCIEIFKPDDNMLIALIAKLFNDKQIIITQEILEYIIKNTERSFKFITKLIDEIDEISWQSGRAVSIPIVREAFKNLSKNQQLELFI